MALNNDEVLGNLKSQLKEVSSQLNQLTETRLKLLEQLMSSNKSRKVKRNQYNPKLWRLRRNEIF